MWPEPGRFTPYHLPHSTSVAGLSTIYSGDDRYFNNIFLGISASLPERDSRYNFGLRGYEKAKLPVWIDGNVYTGKAVHYTGEKNFFEDPVFASVLEIREKGNEVFITVTLNDKAGEVRTMRVSTATLGKAKMARAGYENPDGTPIVFDTDYNGQNRSRDNPAPGPFENRAGGTLTMKVWPRRIN
jgi:hypothetical protein